MEKLDFITPPSKTYFCPLTNEFLLQPYQTCCCGNHLSATAVAQAQNICPFCGCKELKCILDKFYQRQLSAINVRCPNKSSGCKWVGNVALLDRHLNGANSKQQETTGNEYEFVDYDCSYVEVPCPAGCPEILFRGNVKEHILDSCVHREYKCEYCGYTATYEEIAVKHWPTCPNYILPCPNGCGAPNITRAEMDAHMRRCPNTRAPCTLACAGCTGYAGTETLAVHMESNIASHLELLAGLVISMRSEGERKNTQISYMERKLKQQDEAIKALTQQLHSLASLAAVEDQSYTPPKNSKAFIQPHDIVMPNFDKLKRNDEWWFSPSFYTHVGGYKMCLGLCPNGSGKFKGSHVSLTFHLMRGPFDDDLVWPFRGELTVQLINQKKGKSQLEESINIQEDTVSEKSTSRVMNGERNTAGFGFLQFVSHKQLATLSGCVENDSLRIRILKVAAA